MTKKFVFIKDEYIYAVYHRKTKILLINQNISNKSKLIYII